MNKEVQSTLSGLLKQDGAVAFWPKVLARPEKLDELIELMRTEGFHAVLVDQQPIHDKESLLAALYVALQLPDWFGFNYDALQEAFEMIEPVEGQPWLLIFQDFGVLQRSDPDCAEVFLEIAKQVAAMPNAALSKLMLL